MTDNRGGEFLSVWTGRDVVRGVHRTRLSKRDIRIPSTQQDKRSVEQNQDDSEKNLMDETHEQTDPRHKLPLKFQSLASSCQLGGGAHCLS